MIRLNKACLLTSKIGSTIENAATSPEDVASKLEFKDYKSRIAGYHKWY